MKYFSINLLEPLATIPCNINDLVCMVLCDVEHWYAKTKDDNIQSIVDALGKGCLCQFIMVPFPPPPLANANSWPSGFDFSEGKSVRLVCF